MVSKIDTIEGYEPTFDELDELFGELGRGNKSVQKLIVLKCHFKNEHPLKMFFFCGHSRMKWSWWVFRAKAVVQVRRATSIVHECSSLLG